MSRIGPELIDLAAERIGGRIVAVNDEFFAPAVNLLRPGRGEFREHEYTDHGKWMDGWETRRRREAGHDWCIIALGAPGRVRQIVVDTNHFRGNHPEACAVEGACLPEDPDVAALDGVPWRTLVDRSPLTGHSENRFPVTDDRSVSHLRLRIFPDGGVARLRVLGEVRPDWERTTGPVDLVSVRSGGVPVAASDQFFSEPLNLIVPGRGINMGDGWETRRRRGPGHDWVVLRLGRRGRIRRVEIDTAHFKGNFPESAWLEGCLAPTATLSDFTRDALVWKEIVPRTRLRADHLHAFEAEVRDIGPVTHVRLSIHPDGGVSRLRVWGDVL